jgi:hypothetical protein
VTAEKIFASIQLRMDKLSELTRSSKTKFHLKSMTLKNGQKNGTEVFQRKKSKWRINT